MAKEKEVITESVVGTIEATGLLDDSLPNGLKLDIYQQPDKWWSFRINGRESHYRSSNPEGLNRTIKALLFGNPPGTVKLRPVRGKGKRVGDAPVELETNTTPDWSDLPTQEQRIEAFLKRGKLANETV